MLSCYVAVNIDGCHIFSNLSVRFDELWAQDRFDELLALMDGVRPTVDAFFNGVMVEGDYVGQTLFYGRGAGRCATASAVVADITDAAINLAVGSVRRIPAFHPGRQFDEVLKMEDTSSRYYLRFLVEDCPGVIASITQILADRSISISSLIQHERRDADGTVALVILTHLAPEREIRAALTEIDTLSINRVPVKLMRIEDL